MHAQAARENNLMAASLEAPRPSSPERRPGAGRPPPPAHTWWAAPNCGQPRPQEPGGWLCNTRLQVL